MEKKFDQQEYIREYNKKNYDCIKAYLPKGSREALKEAAAKKGFSVSGYIVHLAKEDGVKIPEKN